MIQVLFNSKNEKHEKYLPVLKWLIEGRAKLVTGGGKYFDEEICLKLRSYLPIFKELGNYNKTHFFPGETVKKVTQEVISMESSHDFDDPHIVALLSVSKAKIFCSEDGRASRFIHDQKFYPKGQKAPKILSLADGHTAALSLLNDENICSNGLHEQLPAQDAQKLMSFIEGEEKK
jgi:hypothetical protein